MYMYKVVWKQFPRLRRKSFRRFIDAAKFAETKEKEGKEVVYMLHEKNQVAWRLPARMGTCNDQ